jgi:UDP-glucose:tetrahydrobiopterin glucosyltransferase
MNVTLIASPVAPLGAGPTGGVSRHIAGLARVLTARGHHVTVLAPEGSRLDSGALVTVPGTPQPSAARGLATDSYPIPGDGVMAAMCRAALVRQADAEVIVNLAHDWLPYYLTPFFRTPLLHVANLPAINPVTDDEIVRTSRAFPLRVAMLSRAQAATYAGLGETFPLTAGIDMDALPPGPGGAYLAWAGRVSPEKGLETAAEAAAVAEAPLKVAGSVEDRAYLEGVLERHRGVVEHVGYLAGAAYARFLGGARGLLQTSRLDEAFGFVTLEALACGTPVVAYDRGASRELIEHGRTGLLVGPGDEAGLVTAIGRLGALDRAACRDGVGGRYALGAMADSTLAWIELARDRAR